MANQQESIARLLNSSAEVITADELASRLVSGQPLTHYIGFEISGYVHIGQGLMSALMIKDLQALGVQCTIWLADWHTWINEKLDGRKETASAIGQGYFTEAMRASLLAVGADPEQVEMRLASEWYAKNAMQYWETVVAVSQHTTLARMQRSIDIMGRQAGESTDFAKLMYPAMQAADIFYLNVDIAHAGMDQRKAHVIMRDVADKVRPDRPKPMALHHPLLMGLQKPAVWPLPAAANEREVAIAMKMSKSKADSAIWVHDEPEEIERKIKKAFCPEKEVAYNPILNWTKHLLFHHRPAPFRIERQPEHGGNVEFAAYEELERAYAGGEVHPSDLKSAVAQELIALLEPVRQHFAQPEIAAKKQELDRILQSK